MNVPQILIALETKNAATMTVVENHVYQVQFQKKSVSKVFSARGCPFKNWKIPGYLDGGINNGVKSVKITILCWLGGGMAQNLGEY